MSEQTTDLERAAYLLRDAAFGRSEGRQLAAKLEVIAAQLRISAPPMSSELDRLRKETAALREALNKIASWAEGDEVNGSFDEPVSAKIARAALQGAKDSAAQEGNK